MIENNPIEYKVSVVVPIYNVEKYLKECLDSLVAQHFEGLQVIMVDDGSTDDSPSIATNYSDKYGNFTLIVKDSNTGLSAARNVGLSFASGKYVLFLDSDDYLNKNAIQRLYDISEKNELDVLKFNYICNISERGDILPDKIAPVENSEIQEGNCFLSQVSIDPSCCLIFINRGVITHENLSFLEGVIHEDHLFFTELMLVSKRVMFRDFPLYFRRIRSGSIMQKNDSVKSWKSYILMADTLDKFGKSHNYIVEKEMADLVKNAYQAICKVKKNDDIEEAYKLKKYQRRIANRCKRFLRGKEIITLHYPRLHILVHNLFFDC